MELYTATSYELSRLLTIRYSTSFSTSSKLFAAHVRPHIYAIYGLVRIADEIVDTYQGTDAATKLDALESEVDEALRVQYSTNPIVHSFALTAVSYGIEKDLIKPFFDSMRTDLTAKSFSQKAYKAYIYGSAEVIGLMCLKVFCEQDESLYSSLENGASALGAAYQKVNFLRDIASDYQERGRVYFPGVTFESFSEEDKLAIIEDIEADFAAAAPALEKLPANAKSAVSLSAAYYSELLNALRLTPAALLKVTRVRVSDPKKFKLLARQMIKKWGNR